ncbi:hypothetical protein ACS0TY_002320 [Phlomoides rotata]
MAEKVYSFEEVSKHNKPGDCWIIISGKVYDVSQFLKDHPGGGEVILINSTGKDATVNFEDVSHSEEAIKKREELVIGNIDESTMPENEEQYWRRMATSTPNNKSSIHSYNFLYMLPLPLFSLVLVYLLRFYS